MPRVIVMGGSLGGLSAALVLRDVGCDVRVFERSSAALAARGAGIVALPQTLRYPVERGGLRPEQMCSRTSVIRFLDRDGRVRREITRPFWHSSWNSLYRRLLALFGAERYLLGHEVTGFRQSGGRVQVFLADGSLAEADLLVCADGVGSLARRLLAPEVRPRYAGYVAWRGAVPERDLSTAARGLLGDALTYQVLDHGHVLVYPIPGPEGEVATGERLINAVWYVNVAEGEPLDRLMTGRDGVRRAVSLPPGAAGDGALARLRADAGRLLAPPLAEVVTGLPAPFVQAVYDIAAPWMAHGRVVLMGDAAFAVRPHAAAATAKAAADGWALAEALTAAGGDVTAALADWEEGQSRLGADLLARTREIGHSSQVAGTFGPDHPQLVFGLHGPGR